MEDPAVKIIAQTVADLTAAAARNTVGAVANKVSAAKKRHDQAKTVTELESLINELVNDKIEVERIAKTLENELVSQQISDADIDFIVNTIVPMVEKFTEDDAKQQEYIDIAKQLLSKETLKVMQLIGFNYREAIGKPLTILCGDAIGRLSPKSKVNQVELSVATAKNQTALAQLSADKESYDRFARLLGREDLIIESEKESQDGEHSNN